MEIYILLFMWLVKAQSNLNEGLYSKKWALWVLSNIPCYILETTFSCDLEIMRSLL